MKQPVIVAAKRTTLVNMVKLKAFRTEQLLQPLFNHFKEEYPEIMEYIEDVILEIQLAMVGILLEIIT